MQCSKVEINCKRKYNISETSGTYQRGYVQDTLVNFHCGEHAQHSTLEIMLSGWHSVETLVLLTYF
jgi:hypothetical protein